MHQSRCTLTCRVLFWCLRICLVIFPVIKVSQKLSFKVLPGIVMSAALYSSEHLKSLFGVLWDPQDPFPWPLRQFCEAWAAEGAWQQHSVLGLPLFPHGSVFWGEPSHILYFGHRPRTANKYVKRNFFTFTISTSQSKVPLSRDTGEVVQGLQSISQTPAAA